MPRKIFLLHQSPPLQNGTSYSKHRKRKPERSASGAANIMEFALVLSIVILLMFIPLCNLALFCAALSAIQSVNRNAVEQIAMCDDLAQADSRCEQLLAQYDQPVRFLFHHVNLSRASDQINHQLNVIVQSPASGKSEFYSAAAPLPSDMRPCYAQNSRKFLYSYQLRVNCIVHPFFNLSGIPAINQIPIVGKATPLSLVAEAPVENLAALSCAFGR